MVDQIPDVGDVMAYERTFSTEEVLEFGALTQDQQAIHTEPDETGELVVQGLLVASVMTKIGGEMSYIARTMTHDFKQPVRTGEQIRCEWTVTAREDRDDRYTFENDVVYRNEAGDIVVEAATTGLIWR